MLKSVLGRTLLCYVPKKKNLGRLIYRNDADVLGSCHSLFLANHRSLNQIALMEKENLKLTSKISSLITDDLKKNTKHESLEHAAQILRNVIKLHVSDRIKTDRLPDIDLIVEMRFLRSTLSCGIFYLDLLTRLHYDNAALKYCIKCYTIK